MDEQIFIDVSTGVWGSVYGLRIVNGRELNPRIDVESALTHFSPKEICEFGKRYGMLAVAYPTAERIAAVENLTNVSPLAILRALGIESARRT